MPDEFEILERGDHAELADRLVSALGGSVVAAEGALWRYDAARGVYVERTRDECLAVVKGFAGAPVARAKGIGALRVSIGDASGAFAFAVAASRQDAFFRVPDTLGVTFTNGFLAIGAEAGCEGLELTAKLREHAPENRARYAHAFAYDPTADRSPLLRFFSEIFADCAADECAKRVALLQEFAGACLFGFATSAQKSILLVGPGGNGKSQLLTILRAVVPDGLTVSIPPQQWVEKFQAAMLLGKLMNVVDELPEAEIIKTGAFKSVVTGEPMLFERKHVDSFNSAAVAGHVFAANSLPSTSDLSDAFFRRFVIVPLERRFDGSAEVVRDIGAGIVKQCRPGIVAWAVDGAARLLAREGTYTEPGGSAGAIEEWRRTADSVLLFATEQCEEGETLASALYASYRDWARSSGLNPVSVKKFALRLREAGRGPRTVERGALYPLKPRAPGSIYPE